MQIDKKRFISAYLITRLLPKSILAHYLNHSAGMHDLQPSEHDQEGINM